MGEPAAFGGAMPKAEIGVDRFSREHPDADGRNVLVAIFDSGVDPGGLGLGSTSDGKPKVERHRCVEAEPGIDRYTYCE